MDNKLYIGPLSFDVVFKDKIELEGYDNDEHIFGCVDFINQQILVDNTLSLEHKKSVIMHEIIHAIDYVYGIDLSERDTQTLANSFISFINDNYDFYQAWETMDITQEVIEGMEKEFAIYHSKKDEKELN